MSRSCGACTVASRHLRSRDVRAITNCVAACDGQSRLLAAIGQRRGNRGTAVTETVFRVQRLTAFRRVHERTDASQPPQPRGRFAYRQAELGRTAQTRSTEGCALFVRSVPQGTAESAILDPGYPDRVFVPQIRALVTTVLDRLLPAFDNPEAEADRKSDEKHERLWCLEDSCTAKMWFSAQPSSTPANLNPLLPYTPASSCQRPWPARQVRLFCVGITMGSRSSTFLAWAAERPGTPA